VTLDEEINRFVTGIDDIDVQDLKAETERFLIVTEVFLSSRIPTLKSWKAYLWLLYRKLSRNLGTIWMP